MAKADYTDSTVKELYKTLVSKPAQAPDTIVVAAAEKRTRAELLDMVEELFQTVFTHTSSLTPDLTKLRAILHILIKSVSNTSDDSSGISASQANAITANTAKTGITPTQAGHITANNAKVSQGLVTANHTLGFNVTNSRGAYALVITVVDSSGKTVTKTATINLS